MGHYNKSSENVSLTRRGKSLKDGEAFASPAKSAATEKKSSGRPYYKIWLATQVFDWTWTVGLLRALQWWFTEQNVTDPWGFVQLWVLVASLLVWLIARDDLMAKLLVDVVSKFKVNDGVPRDLSYIFWGPVRLATFFTIPIFLGGPSSPVPFLRVVDWHYDITTLAGAWSMWLDYLMHIVWKDLITWNILHRIMHENWFGLYAHHKEHHIGNRNANVFNSTKIDFVDDFLESGGIAYIFVPVAWALGLPTTMHFGAMAIAAISDVQVHSLNPYTVTFYNPFIDYVLMGNVQHMLHHAKGKDNYALIPYHHLIPSMRRHDVNEYNRMFETSFPL